MLTKVDLNLLPVFMEVYRLNSITLASEVLETTQPAVSNILKRLSDQLGEVLFVREGRGIAPTTIAVQLATDIQPLLNGMASALENVQTFDINKPRIFTVYVTELTLLMLQPLVNKDPTLGACNIQFVLAPAEQDEVLDQLSMQQADLAITMAKVNHPSFNSKPVHEDNMYLTCARDHPRVQGDISLKQYYEESHVGIKRHRSGLHEINMLSETQMQERKVWVRCDSVMSGLTLAAKTDILCLAPETIARDYCDLFNLQLLKLPYKTRPIVHSMIWHKRTSKSQAHQWLREKLMSLL